MDRTALHIFTIDPSDAKDHDDALSIEPLPGNSWEVGIHIADVSYYVEKGSPLDLEALRRGTSVYLVDRVVPMLPHVLSSDLCSLRPEVDRAAVSLFVTLGADGGVSKHRFERTKIRSRHRLDYDQVQSVLTGEDPIDARTDKDLRTLATLARALREKRIQRGSLDFDLPEARVILGEDGAPIDIQKVVQLESHRLIEDFMLLANETVAREAGKKKLPIPYRVHDHPRGTGSRSSKGFSSLWVIPLGKKALRVKTSRRFSIQSRGNRRPPWSPRWSFDPWPGPGTSPRTWAILDWGHRTYTHFTSPIRRYPDLMVHRVVIRALIEGEADPERVGGRSPRPGRRTIHRKGRTGGRAERDSVALKKAEFMEQHLGEEFSGTVSGVTAFGIFVLLDEYFVEGLVHVNSLMDDYYLLREEEYALVGERTGRRFRLGDALQVQVSRVNRLERKIDFVLAGSPTPTRFDTQPPGDLT